MADSGSQEDVYIPNKWVWIIFISMSFLLIVILFILGYAFPSQYHPDNGLLSLAFVLFSCGILLKTRYDKLTNNKQITALEKQLESLELDLISLKEKQ